MPGTLRDRVRYFEATLRKEPQIRLVGLGDAIHSAISYYALQARRIESRMRVSALDADFAWVDLGRYGLAWPRATPLGLLAKALVELWIPSNPHFYFSPLTPISAGDVVVDVGACEGTFALECLRLKNAQTVYCFEPGAIMAEALRITARQNGLPGKMHVVEAAVGAVPGRARFAYSDANPLVSSIVAPGESADPLCTQVEQLSLDAWADAENVQISYIKIDAEGSDLDVLIGAESCLKRGLPRVAVTTYHHPDHCNRIHNLFNSLQVGYRLRAKGLVTFDGIPRPVMLHGVCAPSASVERLRYTDTVY